MTTTRRGYQAERRQARKNAGLCARCLSPAKTDSSLCDPCGKKKAEYSKKRRLRLAAEGKCRVCGAASGGACVCTVCAVKRRASRMMIKYGITLAEFDVMLAAQRGCCAICEGTDVGRGSSGRGKGVFHVDHDHATGKVRGLLCTNCNKGLGFFLDDSRNLSRAIEYLRQNNGPRLVATGSK